MQGKKLNLEEIRERVYEINKNIEILSDLKKEIGKNKKRIVRYVKCHCLIDGCVWEARLSHLLNGRGCPDCGKKALSESKKMSLEEIKNRLYKVNKNIMVLGIDESNKSNKGRNRYLRCKCLIDNCEWSATINSLINRGSGCPECGGTQKLSLEEIRKKVFKNNKNIEIISIFYKESGKNKKQTRRYAKCRCLIDNHEWNTEISHLLHQNCGCPICALANQTGKNHWNWQGGITPLHNYLREHILQWKKDSIKACDYKCVITSFTKNLIVHHLYGFDRIIKETMEILNLPIYNEVNKYTEKELKQIEEKCLDLHCKYGLGGCLSEEVHKLFHSIYGYGNNTPEQFEEFREKYFDK